MNGNEKPPELHVFVEERIGGGRSPLEVPTTFEKIELLHLLEWQDTWRWSPFKHTLWFFWLRGFKPPRWEELCHFWVTDVCHDFQNRKSFSRWQIKRKFPLSEDHFSKKFCRLKFVYFKQSYYKFFGAIIICDIHIHQKLEILLAFRSSLQRSFKSGSKHFRIASNVEVGKQNSTLASSVWLKIYKIYGSLHS